MAEVSNFRTPASGHWYFTLKDDAASLAGVMFRGSNRQIKFHLKDGMEVLVRGRLTLYEPRGQYQLVAEHMEPKGVGALQLAFEQLRQRLEKEGLFAPERKRPLPYLPQTVGLVTSISGAAVRDVCDVIFRRSPGVRLRIHPVRVQGEGAAGEIAHAIEGFGRRGDAQVLIVARGGGSIEDLWAFNEEVVARAIAACPIPVVSAVGHETDFTIADFVADMRAPTPSAAAELVVPVHEELLGRVAGLQARLVRQGLGEVERGRLRVHDLAQFMRDPRLALAGLRRRLDEAEERLSGGAGAPLRAFGRRLDASRARLWGQSPRTQSRALGARLEGLRGELLRAGARQGRLASERVHALAGMLEALSPLAVLARGYAVAELPGGEVVREARQAPAGANLRLRLHRGHLAARVTDSWD